MNTKSQSKQFVEMVNNMELYGKPGLVLSPVLQIRAFETLLKNSPSSDTRQTFWQRAQSLYIKKKLACTKPDWHESVFLPVQVWLSALEPFPHVLDNNKLDAKTYEAVLASIVSLSTWRYSQGVYRFDNYVYKNLFTRNVGSVVSPYLINRLPEWCVYIETPGFTYLGQTVNGVFVNRNYKNEFYETMEPDQLIISFDIEPFYDKASRSYNPQPYAIFNTDLLSDTEISKAYLYGFGGKINNEAPNIQSAYVEWTEKSIDEVFSPLFSLINAICIDTIPVQADAFVWLKPSYKDAIASYPVIENGEKVFKIRAPSNPRVWAVGNTIGFNKRQFEDRKRVFNESFKNMEIHWFIDERGHLGIREPKPYPNELKEELKKITLPLK